MDINSNHHCVCIHSLTFYDLLVPVFELSKASDKDGMQSLILNKQQSCALRLSVWIHLLSHIPSMWMHACWSQSFDIMFKWGLLKNVIEDKLKFKVRASHIICFLQHCKAINSGNWVGCGSHRIYACRQCLHIWLTATFEILQPNRVLEGTPVGESRTFLLIAWRRNR